VIHVFVESNWVVEVCAPAFRRTPEAQALLSSAGRGEIALHLPGIAFREARSVIRRKYQPKEAGTLQAFRRWGREQGTVTGEVDGPANDFLTLFYNSVNEDLAKLDGRIHAVESSPGVNPFALSDAMLERALALRDEVADRELGAFDEAILAAVLVRAGELANGGKSIFCTLDHDLSPVDKRGSPRARLKAVYDAAGLEVRTSFDIS
jgi:hypothetical protein